MSGSSESGEREDWKRCSDGADAERGREGGRVRERETDRQIDTYTDRQAER